MNVQSLSEPRIVCKLSCALVLSVSSVSLSSFIPNVKSSIETLRDRVTRQHGPHLDRLKLCSA